MKFWLRIALSIALVVLLFTYVVDAREVAHILQRFDAAAVASCGHSAA